LVVISSVQSVGVWVWVWVWGYPEFEASLVASEAVVGIEEYYERKKLL